MSFTAFCKGSLPRRLGYGTAGLWEQVAALAHPYVLSHSQLLPSSRPPRAWRKREKRVKNKKEKTRGTTSLVALYSMCWGRSHHWFFGVCTPRAKLPRPTSMTPPRVGSIWAYLHLSALSVRLHRLPRRPGGDPFVRGIVRAFVDTLLTSRRQCPLFLWASQRHSVVLARPRPIGRPIPYGTRTVARRATRPPKHTP
jgi:hypothetical protein